MTCSVILGATGFLGPHLVASAFREAQEFATMADPLGPPVVAVGREVDLAPRYTQPRDGAEWEARDLLVEGELEACLDKHKATHVVLAAALSRIADCEADPELARRTNSELPGRVARWCAANGARLVFLSTDQVFGGAGAPQGGFKESALTAPVSEYGRSKVAGEEAVMKAMPGALIVRLPLLYGDSGGRGLGASDSLLEAVDQDLSPGLFEDEYRTPLEAGNAAEALIELLFGDATGVLHLAPAERVTRLELGLAVLAAMGLDKESAQSHIRVTRRAEVAPGRPEDVSLNGARAAKLLETELLGVREGLAAAVEG